MADALELPACQKKQSHHADARTLGLEGVAMVSFDDDWSALRFKLL